MLKQFISAIGLLALLSGCGLPGLTTPEGPTAEAPSYRVGDRWTYQAHERFLSRTSWEESREIIAIEGRAVTVRISQQGPGMMTGTRVEQWVGPGLISRGAAYKDEMRTFDPPLPRLPFPLVPGKVLNQWVVAKDDASNNHRPINRYISVRGWEKVTTPAGTFDAIRMQVIMHLDDEQFWRHPTLCNYVVWYAPAVGEVVREEHNAEYHEKGGHEAPVVRSEVTAMELASFSRGRT